MSSITRTVWARESLAMSCSPAVYTALSAFLALSAGLFFAALQIGEGTFWSLPALWVLAVALPLPLLAILVTMPLFAGERASGTLALLAILPISLRKVVLGKFLAAGGAVLLGILGALVPWLFLARGLAGKLPPLAALLPCAALLALHGMSWTALGLLCSVLARRPWAAAVGTLLLGGGAILAWAAASRLFLGGHLQAPAFPLATELLDAAAGRLALRSLVLHGSIVAWCLFVSLQVLEARR
jgi:ABC-2 type transport system permease protein